MIFLQLPLSQSVPVAVIEAVVLLALAAALGWWLARLTLAGQTRTLREAIAARQTELDDCRRIPAAAPAPSVKPAAKTVAPVLLTETPPAADPVLSVVDPVPTQQASDDSPDDLKILEGVGPRIETLLHDAGIKTFATLASTSPSRLTEILHAAGPSYQIHDPSTWPQQARLAAEGRWNELRTWQFELSRGRMT
jgi:predicted flap endonuclease-1-like 5' DNA nuclease